MRFVDPLTSLSWKLCHNVSNIQTLIFDIDWKLCLVVDWVLLWNNMLIISQCFSSTNRSINNFWTWSHTVFGLAFYSFIRICYISASAGCTAWLITQIFIRVEFRPADRPFHYRTNLHSQLCCSPHKSIFFTNVVLFKPEITKFKGVPTTKKWLIVSNKLFFLKIEVHEIKSVILNYMGPSWMTKSWWITCIWKKKQEYLSKQFICFW